MLFQNIEGKKLWSVGAMWFKVSDRKGNFEELVKLRKQQIMKYGGGHAAVQEALLTLANEGIFKSYDETFAQHIETITDRMVADGLHINSYGGEKGMLYYYQKANTPSKNDSLAGMWVSCGGVRDYGTPAEIESSILFYLNHFAHKDHRGDGYTSGEYTVVIVEGSRGNVAGRDGADIQESDVLRRYIPNENPVVAHYKLMFEGVLVGVRFRDHNGFFDVELDTLKALGLRWLVGIPVEEMIAVKDKLLTRFEVHDRLVVRDFDNNQKTLKLIKAKYVNRR